MAMIDGKYEPASLDGDLLGEVSCRPDLPDWADEGYAASVAVVRETTRDGREWTYLVARETVAGTGDVARVDLDADGWTALRALCDAAIAGR